ncbi:hypothetical protein MASR1M45_29880 [Candidatus Kapaibacterium sp.]
MLLPSDIEFIGTSELYVATIGGGIFKTTSLTNVNWIPVNTGLRNLNVKSLRQLWLMDGCLQGLMVEVYIYQRIRVATGLRLIEGLLYRDVASIEIAKNGWILAATYGGGVFQSGYRKTWKPSSSGIKNLYVNEVKRNSLGHLFAATNGKGVYVSCY